LKATLTESMAQYRSDTPHGIMFHHFHDNNHPGGQGALTADEFDRVLNFVGIGRILSPKDWTTKLLDGKLAKDDLCITFDDGLKCQFDICMPVLERYGLQCFWFIYSSVHHGSLEKFELYRCLRSKYFEDVDEFFGVFFSKFAQGHYPNFSDSGFDRYYSERIRLYPFYSVRDLKYRYIRDLVLTSVQFEEIMDEIMSDRKLTFVELALNLWMDDGHLQALSERGHDIGLHSYTHPISISRLSDTEQKEQYRMNYEHIKEVCGVKPLSMAHPSNSYNNETIEVLKDLGILYGFRSNMEARKDKRVDLAPFEIPRMDHANILQLMKSE
jgi:peptidoglycan/xylan/chitin deacetylase (PgdA/CDA1 family)